MKKLRKYILPIMIWIFVTVYIVWAVHLTRTHYAAATVERIDVEIVDSTADRRLVTGGMVRNLIARSGIEVTGSGVNNINLPGIERVVGNNGFVGKVAAYTSATGVLHIEVSQRTPLLRFLADGYDRYVTEDGFVFGTPSSSAIYVPVITGSYKPQFPSGFEGYAKDFCEELIEGENGLRQRINDLKVQKIELAARRDGIRKRISELKKLNTKPGKFDGQAKREWKEQKEAEKRTGLKKKEDSLRWNAVETERLNSRIAAEQMSIKKTREKYEDFLKLLNFVKDLESDGFWRSEIVQIIADRSPSGVLVLQLIPRSGSFVIDFGEIANVDAKFAKLMRFYNEGFKNLGWDQYSEVSVAYKGQVVCKKRKN